MAAERVGLDDGSERKIGTLAQESAVVVLIAEQLQAVNRRSFKARFVGEGENHPYRRLLCFAPRAFQQIGYA